MHYWMRPIAQYSPSETAGTAVQEEHIKMVTSPSPFPLYPWHSQLLYLGCLRVCPYLVLRVFTQTPAVRNLSYPFDILLILLVSTSARGSQFLLFIAV